MYRGINPALYERIVEKYQGQVEQLARIALKAGLQERDFIDAERSASESLNTVNIVDWFKRRAVRDKRWQKAEVAGHLVKFFLEVRSWAQSQEENIQQQARIVACVVALMTNAGIFLAREARV